MSVENTPVGDAANRHRQVVLVLVVTVIAFVAIVVLALAGHAIAAGLIGSVWAATCGLLDYRRP